MAAYPFTVWFRKTLRPYLRDQRISRNAIALRLKVTNATIHRWDRGLSFPDLAAQERLAALFETPEAAIAMLVRDSQKQRDQESLELEALTSPTSMYKRRRRADAA